MGTGCAANDCFAGLAARAKEGAPYRRAYPPHTTCLTALLPTVPFIKLLSLLLIIIDIIQVYNA